MGYLVEILLGAAGSLVAAEIWSHSELMARWLVRKAVQRLPAEDQARCEEEWLADLQDMPGALRKLSWAGGCHWSATVTNVHAWRTHRKFGRDQVEPNPPVVHEVVVNMAFSVETTFKANVTVIPGPTVPPA